MNTPAKIGLGLVAVIVAGIIVIAVTVLQNLDGIVKGLIEETGSSVLDTDVQLREVKITLTDGRGELHGLTIANPPGYAADYAFAMEQVALQINTGSLGGEVIVLDEILIDGAILDIEQVGKKSNIKQLTDNIESKAGPSEPVPAEESDPSEILLAVKKFSFINNQASLSAPGINKVDLNLPDIRLTNLGTAQQGLTPAQLAAQMTRQLLQQVERAASKKFEELAKDRAKKELDKQLDENLSEEDKAKVKGLKSLLGN